MKNISIVLNAILLIAVIGLYVIHFSGTSSSKDAGMVSESESVELPSEFVIAFIVEDSLLRNYKYSKEQAEKLDQKRRDIESDFASKAQGLQAEINNYQQNGGNMTINQAKAVEEDLMRKQQNLRQYQESRGQELMREEAETSNELYEKVSEYMKSYAAQKGYSMVMNYRRGNAVLYGHQGLDVTEEVIDGLNEAYEAELTGNNAAVQSDTSAVK